MIYRVNNAYRNLRRVIMHRPGPELGEVTSENLKEFHFRRVVDHRKFEAEYDTMLSLFWKHDVETLLLREILAHDDDAQSYMDHRPNMSCTRDLATVFSRGAVLMGPFMKGRQGDQQMMSRAFRRLNVPILGSIEPPGYLEGGGVTIIGRDTAVVALCDRANAAGLLALRELILGKEVKYFLEVPLPGGYTHIDGIFMVLDEKLCLIYEKAFEKFPCLLYEAGKSEPRHVLFREYLNRRGFRFIGIDEQERREGHLNLVVTEQSHKAIGFERATGVAKKIARLGWELTTFSAEELSAGNGGAHCMTCPLLVD